MMKKKNIVIFVIIGIVLIGVLRLGYLGQKASETFIFDANSFSRVTTDELIEKLGECSEKEDWTNKTSKGTFNVTTYSYDLNGHHYEFLVCDDKVVRASVYSQKYWTGEGELFKYHLGKTDILTMIGVDLGDNSEQFSNGLMWRISSASDTIEEINVQCIDSKEKTFDFVKITYDSRYFD